MKKNKALMKSIFIIILITVIASWFLPATSFSSNGFSTSGFEPIGLVDLLLAPFQFFNYDFVKTHLFTDGTTVLAYSYTSILLVILSTGIFYSILNKTGAYGQMIEDITKKFQNIKGACFVGIAIFFLLLSSILGVNFLSFIIIPFFAAILLKWNYSRISVFSATFLATILGNVVSLTGSQIAGMNNIMYSLKIEENFIFKGLIFLLVMVIFIIYLIYQKTPELEEMKEENKVCKQASYVPLIFLSIFFFLIFIIGCYNLYYVYGITTVTDTYDNLVSSSIGSYPIGSVLFGNMEPLGYWSGFTVSGLLLILGALISFVYSLSCETIVECVKEGTKRMIKPILYVVLASIPMLLIYHFQGNGNFVTTILGFIYNHITKLAVPFVGLATAISGIFIGDYWMISSLLSSILTTNYTGNTFSVSILTMQMIHGLISIVAPTSLFLVAGLTYLEIPYQKWLSYIWKLVGILLAISIIILLLMSIL